MAEPMGIPAQRGNWYGQGEMSDQTSGPTPSYAAPSGGFDPSMANAPRNPYSDITRVHNEIIQRIGGDPFQARPKNVARMIDDYIPQLFNQFFGGRYQFGVSQISPQEYQAFRKHLDGIEKNLQASEIEKTKNLQTAYNTMMKQYDEARKQYNQLYWKTHPSEEALNSKRQSALSQARQAAIDDMKMMQGGDPTNPNAFQMTGPDGKPVTLKPEEAQKMFRKKIADYYRQIAPMYGIKVPEAPEDKAAKVLAYIKNNPGMRIDQLQQGLSNVDANTRQAVIENLDPSVRRALQANVQGKAFDQYKLGDIAPKFFDPESKKKSILSETDYSGPREWIGGVPVEAIRKAKDALSGLFGSEETAEQLYGETGEAVAGFKKRGAGPPAPESEGGLLSGMKGIPDRMERSPDEMAALSAMGMEDTGRAGGYKGPVDYLKSAWDWFTKPREVIDESKLTPNQISAGLAGDGPVVFDVMTGTWYQKPPAQVMQEAPVAAPSAFQAATETEDVYKMMDRGGAATGQEAMGIAPRPGAATTEYREDTAPAQGWGFNWGQGSESGGDVLIGL